MPERSKETTSTPQHVEAETQATEESTATADDGAANCGTERAAEVTVVTSIEPKIAGKTFELNAAGELVNVQRIAPERAGVDA